MGNGSKGRTQKSGGGDSVRSLLCGKPRTKGKMGTGEREKGQVPRRGEVGKAKKQKKKRTKKKTQKKI